MPPRRSSAAARAATAAAVATPMTAATNSHMKTVTKDVAYAIDWKALKKMMTVKYCPRGEIKKLEIELWNLKVKEEVEKYIGGLPDTIRGNVMSYQPKTMEKAIEFVGNIYSQKDKNKAKTRQNQA
ncbi:hypothetical protein Tco_1298663 [Tanacetum coccineum]